MYKTPSATLVATTAQDHTPTADSMSTNTPNRIKTAAPTTINRKKTKAAQVYVLQLEGGYVYVGKSTDTSKRVTQHMQGCGADFTRLHKPTGVLLPRLGVLEGEGDGPERDETLRQMDKLGADKVRGWKYCQKTLGKPDKMDIEANIRELKDLCRRCGRQGHFAKCCHYQTDRHGHKIRTAADKPTPAKPAGVVCKKGSNSQRRHTSTSQRETTPSK